MEFSKFLIKHYFKSEEDFQVTIGDKVQIGSIFTKVETLLLWKNETFFKKAFAIIKMKWEPDKNKMRGIAKKYFMEELFGEKGDYGEKLFELMSWHNSQKWDLSSLTFVDLDKAKALEGMAILSDLRFCKKSYKSLVLNMCNRNPLICLLTYPMIIKIPVVSMRTYLQLHYAFCFNSIRRSKHPFSDDLVDYLYEIMFLQHKIANALHEIVNLIVYTREKKNGSLLINAEVDAIREIDTAITNLKATIEKAVVFIGFIYGINNLDVKKEHQKRIKALVEKIPKKASRNFYWENIYEFLKSENLIKLNNFRTGLLHKKGIASLQPHNYLGNNDSHIMLSKMYDFLYEQHAKNTTMLIGMSSLLTDELVERDPPKLTVPELIDSIANFSKPEFENNNFITQ